jgi:hypothetical protein
MKKLAVAFVLFFAACGTPPTSSIGAPADACASCKAEETCFSADNDSQCVVAAAAVKLESVTVSAAPMKVSICERIINRCFRRCPAGSVDCQAACVDDYIDCVTN